MPAAEDRTHPAAPDARGAAWTVNALRAVWERQQTRVSDRIATVERAIAELDANRLDSILRAEAERSSHMLAGSLGMFGFVEASQAAHGLESRLAHPASGQAPELSALLAEVREGVRGPVTLQGDRPQPVR
jgi:HPt (histidine-containing phosphotransfer) domain-containing protein